MAKRAITAPMLAGSRQAIRLILVTIAGHRSLIKNAGQRAHNTLFRSLNQAMQERIQYPLSVGYEGSCGSRTAGFIVEHIQRHDDAGAGTHHADAGIWRSAIWRLLRIAIPALPAAHGVRQAGGSGDRCGMYGRVA